MGASKRAYGTTAAYVQRYYDEQTGRNDAAREEWADWQASERTVAKTLQSAVIGRTQSFQAAGLLTDNAGFVLKLDDGSEYKVTVVRKK